MRAPRPCASLPPAADVSPGLARRHIPQTPQCGRRRAVASDMVRSTYRRLWWALMLRGIFAIALGALIIWRPMDSVKSLAILIAFWALYTGFVEIVQAFELRRVFNKWWVVLLGGLV